MDPLDYGLMFTVVMLIFIVDIDTLTHSYVKRLVYNSRKKSVIGKCWVLEMPCHVKMKVKIKKLH